MSRQMQLFVSYSHQDEAFARDLVEALRATGTDVWYEEQNLDSGQLIPTVERELRDRPVFLLVLSPAALASRRVEEECRRAYNCQLQDPTRTLLPVTAVPLADETDIWLFLKDFKRVEAPKGQPYPKEEAIRRMLHALALTPWGEALEPAAPNPAQSAAAVLERVLFYQQATQLAPNSFDAWFNLGYSLSFAEGTALDQLDAYERALALEPNNARAWGNKGTVLLNLNRLEEALAAYERAPALDPDDAMTWRNTADALNELMRYQEVLSAAEHALTLVPTSSLGWTHTAQALRGLGRTQEADEAAAKAKALGG
ncbi:MAG: tetratricopeptide repeat protein [Ktedonobacterales bacterium]